MKRHNHIIKKIYDAAGIFHTLAEEARPVCHENCPHHFGEDEDGNDLGCVDLFSEECPNYENGIEYRSLRRLADAIQSIMPDMIRPEKKDHRGTWKTPEKGFADICDRLAGFGPLWHEIGAPKDASEEDRCRYPGLTNY